MKTTTPLFFRVPIICSLLALLLLACTAARGQVAVTVTVDPQTPITPVPADFEGLSVEASSVQGGTYFYAGNTNLVRLFGTLGIKNLRVGGSTVDSSSTNLSNTDIDHLFGFAQAASLKVIFSFRLQGVNASGSPVAAPTDPTIIQSIKQAQYILSNYAASLSCFCIGNEPNTYLGTYSAYMAQWLPYFQAIISAPGCAAAPFCGPSSWPTVETYFVNFRTQFAPGGSSSQYQPNIVFTTQHEYPFGSSTGEKGKTALHDCQKMLINDYAQWYVPIYDKMFPSAGSVNQLPYRLEETNSFSVGGVAGASNAYAAALWGLDYQYWWASQLAGGLNFHTGYHSGSAGANPNAYSAFASASNAPDADQTARGLGYGLLAFKLGAQGTLVSAATSIPAGTSPAFYLNAYAVLGADRSICVTVINKDSGADGNDGRAANVTLNLPASYKIISAQSILLSSSNVTNTTGITLGNSGINADGSFTPVWTPLSAGSLQGNTLTLAVPQASATIVKLTAGPAPFNSWTSVDIGAVGSAGSASYDNGAYTVSGSGADIWNSADAFQFVEQPLVGDGAISARVSSVQNTSGWAKAGVMIRDSLAPGAPYVAAFMTPGYGLTLQWRTASNGGSLNNVTSAVTTPNWVKVARAGNTFSAYQSKDGVSWTQITDASAKPLTITANLSSAAYAGLAVTSHNNAALCTAGFDNVNLLPGAEWSSSDIGAPAEAGFTSYSGGVQSINGGGINLWGTSDQFRYVYQPVSGDFDLSARLTSVADTNVKAKAGLMIRETLASNSPHYFLFATPEQGVFLQDRAEPAGSSSAYLKQVPSLGAPLWLRLKRTGNTLQTFTSPDGLTWTGFTSATMTLGTDAYIGIAATGLNDTTLGAAEFDSISVSP